MGSFSVIMPVYNAEKTLRQAVQSVLNQSLPDFELIAVNDASTDTSLAILEEYAAKDNRIKVYSFEKNAGVAVARNKAIEQAQYRYICFLDSDDLWLPQKLQQQHLAFEQGKAVLFSSYIRFDEKGKENTVMAPLSVSYQQLLFGNCIGNLTGAYDAEKLGKFFQKNIGHEDYLMWLQIVQKAGKAYGIAEPLARYRVAEGSLSANKIKAAQWMWAIYRKELGLGVCKSSYLFCFYIKNALQKRLRLNEHQNP